MKRFQRPSMDFGIYIYSKFRMYFKTLRFVHICSYLHCIYAWFAPESFTSHCMHWRMFLVTNKTGNNALMWLLLGVTSTDDKSTLVQIMAWCRQATSHYLKQCWPSAKSPYDVTKLQWVNYVAEAGIFRDTDEVNTMAADALAPWVPSPSRAGSTTRWTDGHEYWKQVIFLCAQRVESKSRDLWCIGYTHLTQIWAADIDIGNIISCNTTKRMYIVILKTQSIN